MEYKAIYKCRLCGEIYATGAPASKKVAEACMVELNVGICGTVPAAPTATETHYCGGQHAGSMGLADFQGWKKTGRAPTSDAGEKTESGLLEED